MTREELIEQLAEKEHESWANWMSYLFEKCEDRWHVDADGFDRHTGKVIPAAYAEALQKQIYTPYAELSEHEKQYSRDDVEHILPIIEEYKNGPVVQTSLPDGSPSPHVPHPGLGAPR